MPYVDPKPTPREAIAAGFTALEPLAPTFEVDAGLLATDTAFLDTSYSDFALANPGVWQNFEGVSPLAGWQIRMNACEYLINFADQAMGYIQIKQDTDPEYAAPDLQSLAEAVQATADDAYNAFPPEE